MERRSGGVSSGVSSEQRAAGSRAERLYLQLGLHCY